MKISHRSRTILGILSIGVLCLTLIACAISRQKNALPPLKTVSHVDLSRYMGHWRVIAEIPYFAERGGVDSVESYALLPNGNIHNWFTMRKGSFTAPESRIDATAFVTNHTSNSEWKVKFFGGLISAKYLIIDLDPDYQWTVVGHPSRNYGWIMAREKTMSDTTYNAIIQRLADQHYDTSRFKKVPQLPSQLESPQ